MLPNNHHNTKEPQTGCMDMYGDVWICMDMYGDVWICMDMYGYVWICMDMYQ